MANNVNEIVKYVNKCRERLENKTEKNKTDEKLDNIVNSPDSAKLIRCIKKKSIEQYIEKNMFEENAETIFLTAKAIQYKYPEMLNNIINFYISKEMGYYLIKMITKLEEITCEQTYKIIKHILDFKQTKQDFAENVCFMANHFLDISNKVRTEDFKNQATSFLIYQIFNRKNHKKIIDEIYFAIAKKLKNSNSMQYCYIPYGEAYTLELSIFETALNQFEAQLKKEINV